MPHLRPIMDAVTDPLVREIWLMKSAQVGLTEFLLNVIGYFVDLDPAPIMLIQPTLELAEAFSKDRLAPMVRDTSALTGKIADPRSRDSGNTLSHKRFPGGHLTLVGANSPTGLRSRPIRVLLCDEIDGYPASAGSEGDPFARARKRTAAFWNRVIIAGSTPTIKGQSRVEAGFDGSDQRYFHYPCPHCGKLQRLVWPQVKWTEFGLPPEQAVYQCVHCGGVIDEGQRKEMLPKYEVIAAKEFNGIAGFHVHELMSPLVSMGEMAASFVEAKKLPETLQQWVNESLGETWEDTARSIEPAGLAARRESYDAEVLPPGIVMVTVGADTQDDRLEVELVGWGADEESWVLEHKVFRGDPGVAPTKGVWKELTTYRRQRFHTEDGRTLSVQGTGVDFGGHYGQHVANYCHRYRFERVHAVRGVGGVGRLVWPRKPGKTKLSKADIYSVGVDTIKDLLYGRLAKITPPDPGEPKPGYIHLPLSVDDDWCEQFVSETKIYKKTNGRRVAMWRPKKLGSRQEAQDCWNYAYAVMIGRGVDLNQLAALVEKRRAEKTPPDEVAPKKQASAAASGPPDEPEPTTPRRAKRKKRKRLRSARSNYLQRR
jgi:phage terminase large subunit GpA-like protein